MSLPKTLVLNAHAPAIKGCGEDLEVLFTVSRKTRTGTYHRGQLKLLVGRYAVRILCEEIRQMQERDTERINRQVSRLITELAPLRGEVSK